MIENLGDMFTSTAPALGHGVNVKGLMGAGVAREFALRYPEMEAAYKILCENEVLSPGETMTYVVPSGPVIYNMASQEWPGADAQLEWLGTSATLAAADARQRGFDRIAIPRIGCGIGGLSWADVQEVLLNVESLTGMQFEVWVN